MDTSSEVSFARRSNAFAEALGLEDLRQRAPAVFACSAHARTSSAYTFISSERLLAGLMQVGFVPVQVRQTHTRKASPTHARHVIRFRRRFETVKLRDSITEIVLINSHDGTSAYQLRLGVFRVVCTNGLIVSVGVFPAIRIAHRGDVVEDVIRGALEMSERFGSLGEKVEQMERRLLLKNEQIRFAERALALRYPELAQSGMEPSQLLTCRRIEDAANDLWTVLNRVQENLIRGGLSRRSASGRLMRTRGITAIREDIRVNSGLWDIATELLTA
jgi:hypothetical protein